MEAEIGRTLHLSELHPDPLIIDPPHFRFFDRERFLLIRENQPQQQVRRMRRHRCTFDRAAEYRKIRECALADRGGTGKHHGIGRRQGQAIMRALIGFGLFHGRP